ncbi:aromatic acid exporter family protein [Eubacteriales bacterium OttesenSCG-928-M02]|nr:aromatic acid exporter family protein [Eubacteriales bacterium OttesenSCG-928-M02]
MEKSKWRMPIGMRNIKTAITVLLLLLLYQIIGRDGVVLACISAIICMQDSLEGSFLSGFNRLFGTAFGALVGMLFNYILLLFPYGWVTTLLAAVGIVLIIYLCNIMDRNGSITIGCVVFLTIVLQQNVTDPFSYSINRFLDTFIGITLSVLINNLIKRPSR